MAVVLSDTRVLGFSYTIKTTLRFTRLFTLQYIIKDGAIDAEAAQGGLGGDN
jgi:hypothetical protein